MIFKKAGMVPPMLGETVVRLFMPKKQITDKGASDSTQAKPAFCIQVGVPAAILPKIHPLSLTSVVGSPPKPPNRLTVMTSGMTICMVVTPKLPNPALRPSAVPCKRFGKKVPILDMELAKLPPPTPDHKAMSWNTHKGHSGCCKAIPVPMAGASNMAVVKKMVLRPPDKRIKNEAGMRMVAPARPEMAVRLNSSAWLNGKPRLSICTVMMPHMPQMAKPHKSAGTEIQRLR